MQDKDTDIARKVNELWDREEIRQCVHRYARGVDRFDREMIASAFHPDCLDEHGKFVGTPEEFTDWALNQHEAAHLCHQHCLLNHTCELDGDTAHAETYFMFVSMNRQGKPLTLGGGRYVDRLEKRGGDWRIAARVTLRDWSMMDEIPDIADLSSFTSTRASLPEAVRAFMNAGRATARDRSDPSYDRPLTVDPARRDDYRKLMQKTA
ncbi:nuclear transport factor 2 family protein [Antarctobacter sp.]|uniref:nuclear transport factor 2 family protein n=1 Tax=Antarctobacter sp. TaxID=1872577 RepID=UPI003A93867B